MITISALLSATPLKPKRLSGSQVVISFSLPIIELIEWELRSYDEINLASLVSGLDTIFWWDFQSCFYKSETLCSDLQKQLWICHQNIFSFLSRLTYGEFFSKAFQRFEFRHRDYLHQNLVDRLFLPQITSGCLCRIWRKHYSVFID